MHCNVFKKTCRKTLSLLNINDLLTKCCDTGDYINLLSKGIEQ